MNHLFIHNARVVLPGEVLPKGSVSIIGSHIDTIYDQPPVTFPPAAKVIDAQGKYLLPGLIDLHTDSIDEEIVPRAGADFPIQVAFKEIEKKMLLSGITTAYHSLNLGNKSKEKRMQSKYSRHEVIQKVYDLSRQENLIHHNIHIRYEITGLYALEDLKRYIQEDKAGLLSFMDHTPGQGQYQNSEAYVSNMVFKGFSKDQALEHLQLTQEQIRQDDHLDKIIAIAQSKEVAMASHDDDTPEKVEQMYQKGVRICEFPINLPTAKRAKELGVFTLGGASNVLRGGSLTGNLSVAEAVRAGCMDILCSDYYLPAILHAIFILHQQEVLSLPEAVKLATLNPALAAGIARKTGSIEAGKAADLILVDQAGGIPSVTTAIVGGKPVFDLFSGQYGS